MSEKIPLTELQRLRRRGFLWASVATLGSLATGLWLVTRQDADGVSWPLRRMLELNGRIGQLLHSNHRLGENPPAPDRPPRVNGDIGLSDSYDPETWRLSVRPRLEADPISLSLAELKSLPQVEMTTLFKCVEGWSEPISYKGILFSQFAQHTGLDTQAPYLGLETPDQEYYVSIDMASMLHPKTVLATEMNGQPLSGENGAPLRLCIPVKYGIKNIKNIGHIFVAKDRPRDYWAERGYDWYAGL